MIDEKCETGCRMFEGGEVRHDKNCVHYPESRTKMYDDAIDRIAEIETQMMIFTELFESVGDYHEQLSVALTHYLKCKQLLDKKEVL